MHFWHDVVFCDNAKTCAAVAAGDSSFIPFSGAVKIERTVCVDIAQRHSVGKIVTSKSEHTVALLGENISAGFRRERLALAGACRGSWGVASFAR